MDSIRPKHQTEATKITEKTRKLWDSLSAVWVVAVVNPDLTLEKRLEIKQQLSEWDREQKQLPASQAEDSNGLGIENVFKLPLQAILWSSDDIEGM